MTEKKKGIRSSIQSENSSRSEIHSTIRKETGAPKAEKEESRPVSRPVSRPATVSSPNVHVGQSGAAAPSAADELRTRFEGIQNRWSWTANRVALGDVQGELEQLSHRVDSMVGQLASLRQRGYRFGKNLEGDLQKLQTNWQGQHERSLQLLEQLRLALQPPARDVERLMVGGSLNAARLDSLEDSVNALSSRVDAAERQVRTTFGATSQTIAALDKELDRANALMDAMESISFPLYPEESAVAFCNAQWLEKGANSDEGPRGLLFITDARVIFEQREEVVTKRVLFIPTEKETIQKLRWHAPIGAIQSMKPEDKSAFLSHKELLHMELDSPDAPRHVTLRLEGIDNEEWARLVERARSGRIDLDRLTAGTAGEAAGAAAPEAEGKKIPTICPNCGGKLPTLYRGMTQLTCEYCGTVVPVE